MKKILGFVVVLMMVVGIVFLAQSQVAWAKNSTAPIAASGINGPQQIFLGIEGSVQPPEDSVVIRNSGKFSVGGVCTLDIDLGDDTNAEASVEGFPKLPEGVRAANDGCRLAYSKSNGRVATSTTGSATICFAKKPGYTTTIYFYAAPDWTALPTSNVDGLACAQANGTGIYVPTFVK